MIQSGSFLSVIDNSGAKKVMCIRILNSGYKQKYGRVGSSLLVSVKNIKFSDNNKVKKGEIHPALLIRTKSTQQLNYCNYRKYYENAVILLDKKNKPLGTRIFGVIPKQFKYSKFLKLTTLSSGLSL